MSADWIEGRFEGIYSGPRRANPSSRRKGARRSRAQRVSEPRRFGFEIQSGSVRDLVSCDQPHRDDAVDADRVVRQDRIRNVRLAAEDGSTAEVETALFDVEISDWELRHPAEDEQRAYGTIVGRIRARRRPASQDVPDPGDAKNARPEPDARDDAEPTLPPERHRDRADDLADPAATVSRMGWAVVLCLLGLVFAGLAYLCGPRHAALWLAPIAVALLQLQVTGEAGTPRRPGWIAVALMAPQLFVVGSLLDVAWETRCMTSIGTAQLAILAAPVMLAAILGSRGALWLTGAIWTLSLCASCTGAGAATCGPSPASEVVASAETPRTEVARRRTDEGGRWPVMPPLSGPDAGTGAGGASGSSSGRSAAPTGGGLEAPATRSTEAPGGPPDARSRPQHPSDGPATTAPATPDRARESGAQASEARRPADAMPATARDSGASQVDGGWLSPDHRQAPRQLVLISIEQANRTPALFFESGGAHRVYVPTDPIFKDGSAELRKGAPLVLARIAALLSLPAGSRVALDVHSDSAGAPDSQLGLCESRADRIRSWLQTRGHIPPSRFEMLAVGGGRPLVPPDGDHSAQQPNRRIEIRLVEGG